LLIYYDNYYIIYNTTTQSLTPNRAMIEHSLYKRKTNKKHNLSKNWSTKTI